MRTLLTAGRAQSLALLVLAATIWGATFVVTKPLLSELSPFTIMTVRFVLGFVVLLPAAWKAGLRVRRIFDREIVAFGFTGMVLHLALEITGLRFTTASSASLVIASSPAITGLLAFLVVRERLGRRQVTALMLSVVGAVVVTGATYAGGTRALLGNALVLAGVVAWGIYTLQGRRLAAIYSATYTTTGALGIAAVMSAPMAGLELARGGPVSLDGMAILSLVFLGVGASAVAFWAWNMALAHVPASTAAPFVNLVPVLGLAFGLMSGESVTIVQLAGGALVGLGLWLTSTRSGSTSVAMAPGLANLQKDPTPA